MASKKIKRPALTPETYQRLDVYRAMNGLQNSNEAIADLLDRVGDLEEK